MDKKAQLGIIEAKFMVVILETDIKQLNTQITIVVKSGDKVIDRIKSNFLGKIETFRKKKK